MKARFILLCVIGVSQAFNLHARCKSSLTAKCKSSSILSMVVVPDIKQQISEKKQDSVIFEYYNAPRLLDSEAIVSTIKRQIFLLVSALLFGVALETDVLRTKTLSVDKDSVLFGLLFGLPSLVGSYLRLMIMENMPPDYMRPSTRAANLAILRLFGRKTPDRMVAMSTSVVAFGSGISEEIFFRGFCYTVIAKAFGDMKALLASSLIFATAHYFVFKTNLVTEFIYGILLALLFTTSGYNLCVPIVAHVLHDFFFMFITWKHNARKLGEFAIAAKTDELSRQVSNDPSLFQATSRKVFDFFDLNGDGLIDEEDMARGMHFLKRIYCALYHFTISERSNLFYKHMEPTRALFYKMDKSKIGLISYQDFYPIVREDSKHLGWLFKAKAMIEEDL